MPKQGTVYATCHERDHRLTRVAWSPDGQKLACGTEHGYILVFDAHTGSLLTRYNMQNGWISRLSWSPDGQWILVGYQKQGVAVWNIVTNKIQTFYTHNLESEEDASIQDCAWSPDSHMVVSSGWEDHPSLQNSPIIAPYSLEELSSLQIRDAQSGERLYTFFPREPFVELPAKIAINYQPPFTGLSWSPDGQFLAFMQAYKLHIWEPAFDNMIIAPLSLPYHILSKMYICQKIIAWSPDATTLAIACSNRVVLWHTSYRQIQRFYREHRQHLDMVTWLPDGKRLLSVEGSDIHLWEARYGTCLEIAHFTEVQEHAISDAAISPDHQSVAFVGHPYQDMHKGNGVLWIGRHNLSL